MAEMLNLRQEALDRQKLLFDNRCIGCPYRDPHKYTRRCMDCPIRDEFLEIGEILDKTIRSAG